jgi:hypothetical protein
MQETDFLKFGFEACGQVFEPALCKKLLEDVDKSRDFNALFLDEKTFRENPQMKGVNPRPGRNLLGRLEADFIFGHTFFAKRMEQVLGPSWRVLDHKFVMGVPDSWLPDWVREETEGAPVANLGGYIRPEFRDMTYFHGIDFHQDIIDYKTRNCDFVTAYVYLDEAGLESSPLHVIPKSQEQGASKFPHKIVTSGMQISYSGDNGQTADYDMEILTGPPGSLYFWHPATLHGTMPHKDSSPRISVRILAEKNDQRLIDCELDQLNAKIDGPLSLLETRRDLDEQGNAILRENIINKI